MVKIPEGELLDDIRRVASKLGEPPTCRDYNEHGSHHAKTIRIRFGSWNDALEKAELPVVMEWNIDPIDILKDIVECSSNGVAPSHRKYDSTGKYAGDSVIRHFGSWWKGVVQAGVKPRVKRPLTPKQFHQYFNAAKRCPPADSFPLLLLLFTGLEATTVVEIKYDWLRHNRDKNIVRVPSEHTQGSSPWLFRLPEEWMNPHTGEWKQTMLPETADWVLNNHGEVPRADHKRLEGYVSKVAESVDMDNRESYDYFKSGRCPVVRPADLAYSHGANLVRQGVDSNTIDRRLGVDEHRRRFDREEVMLWVYVHDGYEHPEFDPPPVVLDPDTGEPRRSDSEPSESV